jgi:hypothetical protein
MYVLDGDFIERKINVTNIMESEINMTNAAKSFIVEK